MKRKLVKQGGSVLTLSLPAKWIKKQGLKAGDEINVFEEGSKLVINQEKKEELGEYIVKLPEDFTFSKRFFRIPYMKGYNSIKIYFKKKEVFDMIQQGMSTLLGFEIVEQGPDYCIIKNIAKGIESEFDTIFNRQMLVVKTYGAELHDALKRNDTEKLETLFNFETLSNKFGLFCKRMLNLYGYKDEKKTNSIYHITSIVEQIADEYSTICDEVIAHRTKASKECLELLEMENNHFALFYQVLNKTDIALISDLKKMEEDIKAKILKLEKTHLKEAVIVGRIRTIRKHIQHATEELFFVSE